MKALNLTALVMTMLIMTRIMAQPVTLSISFTAADNMDFIALDSIRVVNLTHPGDTMLYYPDTVLVLTYVTAIGNTALPAVPSLELFSLGANPFSERTLAGISVPSAGMAEITVFNLLGQQLLQQSLFMETGKHTLRFRAGGENQYLLRVSACGQQQALRLCCPGTGRKGLPDVEITGTIDYQGVVPKSQLLLNDFWFCPGDELRCIGFASSMESGFNIVPQSSALYTFQFASNIPCPGLDSLLYEGQWYHTVQIFGQCWMAENLNVGVQINTPAPQTDNELTEKYCLLDIPALCETYGGVYLWDEMMQYSTVPGSKGICPEGWHIPTDHDWQVLAGATDSYWGIGDPVWNTNGNCGTDCAYNLKSTTGWYNNGNGSNLYGFNALSGGYYYFTGNWAGGDLFTIFFSSTKNLASGNPQPWSYGMSWMWDDLVRMPHSPQSAMPVRCIKDL